MSVSFDHKWLSLGFSLAAEQRNEASEIDLLTFQAVVHHPDVGQFVFHLEVKCVIFSLIYDFNIGKRLIYSP